MNCRLPSPATAMNSTKSWSMPTATSPSTTSPTIGLSCPTSIRKPQRWQDCRERQYHFGIPRQHQWQRPNCQLRRPLTLNGEHRIPLRFNELYGQQFLVRVGERRQPTHPTHLCVRAFCRRHQPSQLSFHSLYPTRGAHPFSGWHPVRES